MKFLVLIAIVAFVLWLMWGRKPRVGRKPPPAAPRIEGMVACTHCGLNLPRSEAVFDDGRPYCSEAHRLAGPAAR